MSTEIFSFVVTPTDPQVPLNLSVWINQECVWDSLPIDQKTVFSQEIPDDQEQEYCVKITMSGKTDQHTTIDEQGNIIKDALLTFGQFELMGIDISNIVENNARYRHNHNGHSDEIDQHFAMSMGCNGTVEIRFTAPAYLWLLENL